MCRVSIVPSLLRASIRDAYLLITVQKLYDARRIFITDKLMCGSIEMPIKALKVINLSD